ncbi:hypothetical protein DDB_G0291724 [Dictyostelium discoideum AX4]|uniref:hypothetical protein n=1 Tax=Dictyostelium discoideum AX4 TaxID=352472 RepID=UPI00004E347C|nr:hypothetical protein DDB_G0291724 [Dictyostelium discoideum AX4]EAL61558.1 hypothetical protein DDB_G0291724 [Dictyostelium discoideum AX4]|eukprot:XP_629993.1 hypothetical protein DDB_G0291724 [Dictyostelium discoideum AX4]
MVTGYKSGSYSLSLSSFSSSCSSSSSSDSLSPSESVSPVVSISTSTPLGTSHNLTSLPLSIPAFIVFNIRSRYSGSLFRHSKQSLYVWQPIDIMVGLGDV